MGRIEIIVIYTDSIKETYQYQQTPYLKIPAEFILALIHAEVYYIKIELFFRAFSGVCPIGIKKYQ